MGGRRFMVQGMMTTMLRAGLHDLPTLHPVTRHLLVARSTTTTMVRMNVSLFFFLTRGAYVR
jgi:hypothetical protein